MPSRIKRTLLFVTVGAVVASGALSASAPGGKNDVHYFYGELQNRKMGDIRFVVLNGVAQDIVVRAHGKCVYKGEKVRPYFGSREASGINDTEVGPDGTFHERQRIKVTLNRMELPYIRQITARVGTGGAEATGRIEWDTIYGGRQSKKVAHCDTGNRFAELDEISRDEYVAIAEDSGIYGSIP